MCMPRNVSLFTLGGFVVYNRTVRPEPCDCVEGGAHVQCRGSFGTERFEHHSRVVFGYLRGKRGERRENKREGEGKERRNV